jgi:hypothetical protein
VFGISLVLAGNLGAEVMYETGSLRDFLGGNCPGCQYDNWVSHISEGIALEGFNDYGPPELDPQTNGFGTYRCITTDSIGYVLLNTWYDIFMHLLAADTTAVMGALEAAQLDTAYQFVVLSDSLKDYYILREVLNLDYYDEQLTPEDSSDDVIGSFDLGWGLYVFSPTATQPAIIIEAPHPCDDYITPFVAMEAFELFDAGMLMVSGAGREVKWTEIGEYDNTKSLSDPTRVYQSVLNTAHRAFVDYHPDEFAVQVHSYDSDEHGDLLAAVVSAGPYDNFPNEPILDPCAYDDMISFTPNLVVPANTCGIHSGVTIEYYYQVHYSGGYYYQGGSYEIPANSSLPGYGANQQITYSHRNHDRNVDKENIIHIEMDEFPNLIRNSIYQYYFTALPGVATFDNFVNPIEFFRPMYIALDSALQEPAMQDILHADPSPLIFPGVPIYESDTLTLYFQNVSLYNVLTINGASTTDTIFTVLSVPIGQTLYPGQICSLTVVFSPQHRFTYSRRLTLSTDEGCCYVMLEGAGLAAYPYFSPGLCDFHAVHHDSSDTLTVNFSNAGNCGVNILSAIHKPPHYFITSYPDTTIPPLSRAPVDITFVPLEYGLFRDTVYVVTNAVLRDTVPLYVVGEGGFIPAAPSVNILYDPNGVTLGWEIVDETVWGNPMLVTRYNVYIADSLGGVFQFYGSSAATTITIPFGEPPPVQGFYYIEAMGEDTVYAVSETPEFPSPITQEPAP